MKTISKLIYKLTGWKATGGVPEGITKAVFIIAPHTSNLDFYIGRMYCWMKDIPIKVVMKKEAFFWPFGSLLKKVGGVPIDRSKRANKVDQIVELFKVTDPMFFALTPEGTRKRVNKWKRGFYFMSNGEAAVAQWQSVDRAASQQQRTYRVSAGGNGQWRRLCAPVVESDDTRGGGHRS